MANYQNLIPFIMKWEGGLSKNKSDYYAKFPVDASGYHTNKGVAWKVFSSVYGSDDNAKKRWYAMSPQDWSIFYKKNYWDKMQGDLIKSQRIADVLVNWAWGSGTSIPSKAIQRIVGVNADGVIGNETVNAINKGNEAQIFAKLQKANLDFFDNLTKQPKYAMFKTGWDNRLKDLYNNFVAKAQEVIEEGVEVVKKNPINTTVLVLAVVVIAFIVIRYN
jgi:lysozyme family protein